ncbi:hypothetical protein MRX96_046710 [Rhipicephalus microplus]
MSGFVLSIEGEKNVLQYLDYLGLDSVSKAFEEECLAHSKPIQESFASYRNERTQKVQKELLSYFDEGKQAQFFAVWDSVVSRSTMIDEAVCRDLEFHLRLHFAIYPQRYPEKANVQGSMTAEAAMTNFQKPRQFPVFKPIFEESWVDELKSRLEKFVQESLSTHYQQRAKPRLMDLYYCSDVELNDMREDFRRCEQRLKQCEEQREVLDKQMCKLQEDYKTLVSVTTELITALEATVRGDLVNLENVLLSCGQRFPELVKLQTPLTSRGSTCDGTQVFVLRSGLHTRRTRIKQDLSEASASTRALLLQALRWKLTKASSVEERDCVLLAYIDNDLLGFIERSPDYCNRILHITKSPNSGLQQSFVRFLNTLAAFRLGRSYLAKNLQLVAVLTDTLVFDRVTDPRTLDMILGVLQKLSLRRQQKDIMISHGILEWVVRTLQESQEVGMSEYGLEYITALFMNLCLQKSGSLLYDPEFRSIAVEMGLEGSLQKAKAHSSADVQHQLDPSLRQAPFLRRTKDTISQRALTVSRLEESSPYQSLEETTVNAPETSQSDEIDCSQATQPEAAEFTAPPVDEQASELVKQLTGEEKTLVAPAGPTAPPSDKVNGLNLQEYSIAFSSRPKIPRTPEPSGGGTSSRMDSTPTSSQSLRRSPTSTASRGKASSVHPAHSTTQE